MFISERLRRTLRPAAPRQLQEAAEAYEREHDVPVRLLEARGQSRDIQRTLSTWSGASGRREHYPHVTNWDDDTIPQRGVTIISNSYDATLGEARPASGAAGPVQVPADYFIDGRGARNGGPAWNYYVGSPQQIEANDGVPITYPNADDHPYAAVYGDGRVMFFGWALGELTAWGELDFAKLLFQPLLEASNPEIREEARQRRLDESRRAFTTLLQDRGDQQINELRARASGLTVEAGRMEERLVNAKAELDSIGRHIRVLLDERGGPITEDEASVEWDRILDIAHVKDIQFRREPRENPETGEMTDENVTMVVLTDLLWIEHPDTHRRVPLGEFRFELDFGANSTRLINTTHRQRNRWDHPHVSEGELCAGEFRTTITTMLRNRDISGLLGMLFNVLRVVTMRDEWGGANMPFWIEADDMKREEEGWPAYEDGEETHPMLADAAAEDTTPEEVVA